MDWTETYRPRSLEDIIGNGPSVQKLRAWADAWRSGVPDKRAIVLAGPPGTGKTSAALALARDMDWSVIELNASDARNAERIKRVATAGAMHQTFAADGSFHSHTDAEAGRKLIILDEADNLYERLSGENAAGGSGTGGSGGDLSDRGGKTQIIATIRETKQPVILIVNDLYALQKGSGSALRGLAETLKFTRINVRSIPNVLDRIARAEGVQVDRPVLEAIAQNASGDLRAAVRDLESLCAGRKKVTLADMATGYRDTEASIFDVVRHILKGRSVVELRREVRDVDATPEDLVLWVDENLPKEYVHPEDLVAGYDVLSRADVFLGRTRRTQNYRLWSYASELATAGVMTAKRHKGPTQFVPFGFPQWLSKMSRSRAARQTRDNLALVLGRGTHAGRRKTRNEQMPVFEALFRADEEFAVHQTWKLELDDEQVGVLLGPESGTKRIKAIRDAVAALDDERGPATETAPPGGLGGFDHEQTPQRKAPAKDEDAAPGQRRLF